MKKMVLQPITEAILTLLNNTQEAALILLTEGAYSTTTMHQLAEELDDLSEASKKVEEILDSLVKETTTVVYDPEYSEDIVLSAFNAEALKKPL